MIAQDERTYAQVQHDKVHWLFTKKELPEWNNITCPAVDITDLPQQPDVGWAYDGVSFSAPPAPAAVRVEVVDMRQARRMLDSLGVYTAVQSAMAGMSTAAQIDWEFANTVVRTESLTREMVNMLGWTPEQEDAFFLEASTLCLGSTSGTTCKRSTGWLMHSLVVLTRSTYPAVFIAIRTQTR